MSSVKCVVWDLDGTVWPDVAIERADGQPAEPRLAVLQMIDRLEQRGIVNSVASRSDPAIDPLGGTPLARRFLAPQIGWGDKSDAISRIATELGISTGDMALVDDSAFERAEVSAMLPEVRVLTVEEIAAQIDTPLFSPESLTGDARRRVERYREEGVRRQAERRFAGSREEFLRGCDIRLRTRTAELADVDRVAELVARTHRFNTTGATWSRDEISRLVTDPGWWIPVASLWDMFGDYGMVGTAVVERREGDPWILRLFTVSCRAAGRDVPAALLGWIMASARAAGAASLAADVRADLANTEVRILLRQLGFAAAAGGAAGATATVVRRLDGDLPPTVPWLHIIESTSAVNGD